MPTHDPQGRQISDDGRFVWDGQSWQPLPVSGPVQPPLPPAPPGTYAAPPKKSSKKGCFVGCLVALVVVVALIVAGTIWFLNSDTYKKGAQVASAVGYAKVVSDHTPKLTNGLTDYTQCGTDDLSCQHAKAQIMLNEIKSFRTDLASHRAPPCLSQADSHLSTGLNDLQAYFTVAAVAKSEQELAPISSQLTDGGHEFSQAGELMSSSNCTNLT